MLPTEPLLISLLGDSGLLYGSLLVVVAVMVGWIVLWNHILQRRVEDRSRKLADSEAFLERLFQQSPFGMWVANAEGTMLMMNQAGQQLFGIPRVEEVVGRYNIFEDNVVQELRLMDEIQKAFRGKTVTVVDTYDPGRLEAFDIPSKPLHLRSTFTPILNIKGDVNHVLVMHEDMTPRSQAEEELRVRNRQVWALLEAYSQLTSTLDPQEVLSRVSSLAVKAFPHVQFGGFFLYEPEDEELKLAHAIGFEHEDRDLRLPRGSGIAGKVFEEGQTVLLPDPESVAERAASMPPAQQDFWKRISKGRTPESAIGVPLVARNRSIGVLVLVTTDPAGRFTDFDAKLLEAFADHAAAAIDNAYLYEALVRNSRELEGVNRKLQNALDELQVLDEMKTNLLSNVSHELRTPLIAIMGYTDLLLSGRLGPVTEEQKNRLEISLRNAQRLSKRIEDLLNFSRSEMGEMALDISAFDLGDVIREAIEAVQTQASDRHLQITRDFPSEDMTIRGDREKILQVFTNLLDNAIKFNKEGGSVKIEAKPFGKGLARVNIIDSGIGIPQDALERIFERFYQVDASLSRPYGGTGIGLSLVRSIVNIHGGRVRVTSEVGKGSTFSITLPVYDTSKDSGRYDLSQMRGSEEGPGSSAPDSGN